MRHISKGLATRFGGPPKTLWVACPFFPELFPEQVGLVRVALEEVVLARGEYQPTGVTLEYEHATNSGVGVPDSRHRLWRLFA